MGVTSAERAFSLFDSSVEDAYATYERWRRLCPVARSEAFGGHWTLTRFDDVRAAAKDWRTWSSADGIDLPRQERGETIIASDPPRHELYRALFQEALNQKTISVIEPYVVEFAHRLMDGFSVDGTCDLVTQYTEQLPPAVICRIVGLDADLAYEMRDVSIQLGSSLQDQAHFTAALADFGEFVIPQVEARRVSPRSDFLTRLATEPFDGRTLPNETIVQIMVGFLLAGHESTTAAMSAIFLRLLSRPELIRSVLESKQLLSSVIEEGLRLDTPFHHFRRRSTCPTAIAGVDLPKGADLLLNYAAANRDPKEFQDPDSFVPDRRPNRHMAFGFGIHTCVGAPLARMEVRVGVAELLKRFPGIALVDDPSSVSSEFLGGLLAFIPSLRVQLVPPREDEA